MQDLWLCGNKLIKDLLKTSLIELKQEKNDIYIQKNVVAKNRTGTSFPIWHWDKILSHKSK